MIGGKIEVADVLKEVMSTFTIDNVRQKVKNEETEKVSGPFYVFFGDLAEFGSGKLLQKQIILLEPLRKITLIEQILVTFDGNLGLVKYTTLTP